MIFLLLLLASTTLSLALAFTTPVSHAPVVNGAIFPAFVPNGASTTSRGRGFGAWHQKMAADDDSNQATSSPPRKRRTRKDGQQFSPPSSTQSEREETPPPPASPKQNVVVMQVRDIRDVVSGAPEPSVDDVDEEEEEEDEDADEELADDEEWEYYDVDEDGNEIIASDERVEGRIEDDSMEQLLADARRMRSSANAETGEEEPSMKETVFNVISTIVTIDFFVVIGLLVWFLAGIFCSTVLGNDGVQIAFNMNFERVTQP